MNDDRDPKPENVDPMVAVLERRRDMLRRLIEPPGGLVRRPARRGDLEQRRRRR